LPGVDCRAFAEELCTAFGALGRTAVLERPATDDWGAEVAALEEEHAAVVLLALEDGPWRDFCVRQSDRVLAVATGPPAAEVRLPEGCDIAFLGADAARSLPAWRTRVALRTHHVVAPDDPGSPARVARRLAGTSLGLVLSGGGARGFAHLGVLDVLSRESLEIDRVGGTSMGAFIAAMAALGWEPERMIETCKAELAQRAPFSDYTVPRHALTRARRVESMLHRVFGDVTLEELSRPLFTVSADLITGQMVVHRDGPLADAVGASMTIPGLAPPRAHEAQLLIDGGIINNLPIDLMVAEEPGPVVAVDVMRRIVAEDLRATVRASLPTILETISRATVLGSIERAEANRELAGVVISPEVHDVSLRDFRRIDEVIDAGRRAAEASLAAGAKDELLAARSLPVERVVPLARTSA
jgi:NTE family protein